MKTIFSTLFLAGLLIFFVTPSCKLLDVTKEVTFTIDLVVNETDPTFDSYELLDASAESDVIDDYKDKIKSIDLIKVEYTVINFVGPNDQQINSATLDIADENGGGTENIGVVTNENLSALSNTTKELVVNQDGVARIEELIKNSPHKALFHYYGSANSGPMQFTARFFVTVKMTANPLN